MYIICSVIYEGNMTDERGGFNGVISDIFVNIAILQRILWAGNVIHIDRQI
jgi:hypothetical protein